MLNRQQWFEENPKAKDVTDAFVASWKRDGTKDTGADLGGGSIAIKRRMVIVAEEPALEMPAGSWDKSTKIGIETSGSVTIGGRPSSTARMTSANV